MDNEQIVEIGNTGVSGGLDKAGLELAACASGTWAVGSKNVKKLVEVWPTEVFYSDYSGGMLANTKKHSLYLLLMPSNR